MRRPAVGATKMQSKHRWMESVLNQVQNSDIKLPWHRGEDRAAWKARCAARANETDANAD